MLRFTCQCYLNRNLRFISNARSAITSLSSKCDGDEITNNEKVIKKLEVLPINESIAEATLDKQLELSERTNIDNEKDASVTRKKKNWKRKRKKVEIAKSEVKPEESKEQNKLLTEESKEQNKLLTEESKEQKLLHTNPTVKEKKIKQTESEVKSKKKLKKQTKLLNVNPTAKQKKVETAESEVKPEKLMEQIKLFSSNPSVKKSLNSIVNDIDLEQPGSVEKLTKLLDLLNTNPKLVGFFTKQKISKSEEDVAQLQVEGKFEQLLGDISEKDDHRNVVRLMSTLTDSNDTSSGEKLQNLMGMLNLERPQPKIPRQRQRQVVSSDVTVSDRVIQMSSSEGETSIVKKNKKKKTRKSEINDANNVITTSIVKDDINMKQLKENRELRNKGVKLKKSSSLSDVSLAEEDNSQSVIRSEKKQKKKLKKSKSSPDLTESSRDKNIKSKRLKSDKRNIPKVIPPMLSTGEKFEIMKHQSEKSKEFHIDLLKGPSTSLFSGISHKSVTHAQSLNEIDWLKDWNEALRRVLPQNNYHFMMSTIDRQWQFPIDNQQDIGFEESFTDHVFLEHYLEEFPNVESIQKFMELVIIGLQQNPHLTAAQKVDRIMWHKEYFENFPDEETAVSY